MKKKLFLTGALLVALILCSITFVVSRVNANEYKQMEKEINRLLEEEEGTYGVFVKDVNSGKTMGINHMEIFHGASTFKLPLNIYLYQQIAAGKINPFTKLTFNEEHYEEGTGKLQFDPLGSTYEIQLLSRYSIVYSDNVATNMLLSHLGYNNVKKYMKSLGGEVVSYEENITCPRDMVLYMSQLLEFRSKHPELGNRLMSNLGRTIFNDRIPKLLPPDIKVAHKIGNWPPTGTYNDIGYVQHPGNPYIIAIFSKNTPSRQRAFQVIQKISKIVYDHQDNLVKINLLFNGFPLKTDTSPLVKNNTVLVPLRFIAQAINAKINWDGSTNTATLIKSEKYVSLRTGVPTATVNGNNIALSTPAEIKNGRTMVPLRFISEALGATVLWDNNTKTVSINYS
jgi:beta-lactamase class A